MDEISIIAGEGPGPNLIIQVCSGIDDLVRYEGKGLSRVNTSIRRESLADDESYPH
jgi:hypothetical protein